MVNSGAVRDWSDARGIWYVCLSVCLSVCLLFVGIRAPNSLKKLFLPARKLYVVNEIPSNLVHSIAERRLTTCAATEMCRHLASVYGVCRHNNNKTFLIWLNEEDQVRVISMQQGGDVKAVFERFGRGLREVSHVT